jgi:hypothetical protein
MPQTTNSDVKDFVIIAQKEEGTAAIVGYKGSKGKIEIPSRIGGKTITRISSHVFANAKPVNITIPHTITSIDNEAFNGCYNLTAINVDENNTAYSSDDGVLYDKDKTILIKYPFGKKGVSFVVPDSVTSIGIEAFYYSPNLEKITISRNVSSIDKSAFFACDNLSEIYVDNDNKYFITDNGILYSKDKTVLYKYPAKKKESSFLIKDSVINIWDSAFANSTNLESVTIPNSVKNIGEHAFFNCYNLEEITIPNSITKIEGGVFYGCSNFEKIIIPDSITYIGDNAFFECKGIESVNIPGRVTYIGHGAFSKCNFKKIIIPNSVIFIGGSAFAYNSNLKSVTIGNSVTEIGIAAFRDCYSLETITIPDSVTSIETEAFYGCKNLVRVVFEGMIDMDNFSDYGSFPGDLREKYFKNGIGTYTREKQIEETEWENSEDEAIWEYKGKL